MCKRIIIIMTALLMLQGVTRGSVYFWNMTGHAYTNTLSDLEVEIVFQPGVTQIPWTPYVSNMFAQIGVEGFTEGGDWMVSLNDQEASIDRLQVEEHGPWWTFTTGFAVAFMAGLTALGARWVRKTIAGDTPE